MASDQDRLAQIFIWKQATAPDFDYARQVLSVVNPQAIRILTGEDPPLRLFSVFGPWPDDPWGRALLDMRAIPSVDGTQWTDTTQYDLAGWQGTDSVSGDHIFVVSAYRKTNAPNPATIQGAPAPAPSYKPATQSLPSVPQIPYYPQHPTGPIGWPPQAAPTVQFGQTSGPLNAGSLAYYPLRSGPLGNIVLSQPEPTPESYAPYYIGFPMRLFAGLIDLACLSLFQVSALLLYIWAVGDIKTPDLGSWFGAYSGFICLGLGIFAVYHVAQWTIWGQTLGKSLMGIKVVDHSGKKPTFGRALLRLTGYFPSLLLGGIGGFLLIVFDPKRQGLHDKIAETYVIPEEAPANMPAGLPGYSNASPTSDAISNVSGLNTVPSLSLANITGPQQYEVVQLATEQPASTPSATPSARPKVDDDRSIFREIASLDESLRTVVVLPDLPDLPGSDITEGLGTTPDLQGGEATDALNEQALRQRGDRTSSMERARDLFRQGMELMEQGVRHGERGYRIEPTMARKAATAFQEAAELVPNSVSYRYNYGVALRYCDGFEIAIREFRRVLELDPNHYEARQQVAYGQRWHDAFAYPPWVAPPPVEPGMLMPEALLSLLPANDQPITRLVLLREGHTKVVSVLSRTPRNSWATTLTDRLPTRIDIVLSRTPAGPIIAFYVILEDKKDDPYKGETFLNPHDPGSPAFDACQLGQNLMAQLARQDHTYVIFVDEENRLLLSRKLEFDPQTQVNINRCLYEVQTLPAQIMDPQRFQQAAEWHMEHFSLDQVK